MISLCLNLVWRLKKKPDLEIYLTLLRLTRHPPRSHPIINPSFLKKQPMVPSSLAPSILAPLCLLSHLGTNEQFGLRPLLEAKSASLLMGLRGNNYSSLIKYFRNLRLTSLQIKYLPKPHVALLQKDKCLFSA